MVFRLIECVEVCVWEVGKVEFFVFFVEVVIYYFIWFLVLIVKYDGFDGLLIWVYLCYCLMEEMYENNCFICVSDLVDFEVICVNLLIY